MNKHYPIKHNRAGFTLVETMLSLMITAFAILIAGLTFSDIRQNNYHNAITQFYLYLDAVNNYKVKSYGDGRLMLNKDNKNYYIEIHNHGLILTTKRGGNMPLLYHVKNIKWHRLNHGLLNHHIIMQNGQQFNGKSRLNE